VNETFAIAGDVELEVVLARVWQDFDLKSTITIGEIPVNRLLVDQCFIIFLR